MIDFNDSLFTLDVEFEALQRQTLREFPQQLIEPAFRSIDAFASPALVPAWGEVDDLIGAHTSEGKVSA